MGQLKGKNQRGERGEREKARVVTSVFGRI
jgi:hypothetical protein